MERRVTITRTDSGASTVVSSGAHEWSKEYASWEEALQDAVDLKLINQLDLAAAKVLPPGLPFHGGADVETGTLTAQGFQSSEE